jgi:glycosyltransferase involved in cell wall biosynthesis
MKIYNQDIDDHAFICSYIGTIGMAHGLGVVLRAAKYLKEIADTSIVFLIVGDGASKENLEREAKESELANVRFTGLVPKSEISEIVRASDASLIHLKNDALFTTVIPSKMFEIMAMNVPIIMGVKGEARDIVLEAKAGEVMEPEDERELLSAIALIREKGQKYYHGRDYVSRYFDRDKLAQNMLDIILSTVEDKNPSEIINFKDSLWMKKIPKTTKSASSTSLPSSGTARK